MCLLRHAVVVSTGSQKRLPKYFSIWKDQGTVSVWSQGEKNWHRDKTWHIYFLLALVPLGTDLFHNHWDILDWQTPWTWKSARQCWCACSHPGAKSSFWAFCSFYWTVLQSIGEGLWSTDEVKSLGCMCLQATSRPVLGFGSYTFLKNSLSHPAPSEWEKADLEHEHQGRECCNKWA